MRSYLLNITRERFQTVQKEIRIGSEPGIRLYIMVDVSTLIAGFGLVTKSTAVVIGAMLAASRRRSIFGLAPALVHRNPNLMGRALRT